MRASCTPLPTLRPRPRGRRRTARGHGGSLILRCGGLSPPTPCWSPGAPLAVAPYRSWRSPHRGRRWRRARIPASRSAARTRGGRGTWSLGVYGDVGANNEYGNASRNSGNAVGRVTGLAVDRIDSDQQRCAASVPLKARTPTCGTPEVPMKYQERAWPVSRLPGVRRRPAEPAAIGVGSGSRRARATPTVPVPYALAFMEEPR